MKDTEAHEFVTLLAAAVAHRLTPDEHTVWEKQFLPLDADLTYKAIMAGRRTWTFFPSWAKFNEAYQAQKRLSQTHAEQRSTIPEGKRGVTAPEWVHVWFWCRFQRDPRLDATVGFPQEGQWVDARTQMTEKRYEEFLGEWIDAGSPKCKIADLIVALS